MNQAISRTELKGFKVTLNPQRQPLDSLTAQQLLHCVVQLASQICFTRDTDLMTLDIISVSDSSFFRWINSCFWFQVLDFLLSYMIFGGVDCH